MRHIQRLMGLVVLIAAANATQAATPGNSDIVQLGFRNTHPLRCTKTARWIAPTP